MTSTEGPARAHDRHGRRRPFANWMKRFTNLKSLHNDSASSRSSNVPTSGKGKKASDQTHPYSLSSRNDNNYSSFPHHLSPQRSRHSSQSHSKNSVSISNDGQTIPKSRAPTLATTAETTGTGTTAPRTEGDRDSTFSSPTPSLRSITTTLTTMQSTTPVINGAATHNTTNTPYIQTAQPASAVPAHLAPHGHPTTYHHATANNVLTDDASILTLASSSKRRRRNSLDTNASIRALAPTSVFGGSRESLPLSVLSGTVIHPGQGANTGDSASIRDTASSHYPRSTLNAERASLISASGVTAPALTSERNSYISSKYAGGDGASIRSGLIGNAGGDRDGVRPLYHTRNDSLGGVSITTGKDRDRYRDTREIDRDGLSIKESRTAPTSPLPA